MSSDHRDSIPTLVARSDGEGDNGRTITGNIILSSRDERIIPVVAFGELPKISHSLGYQGKWDSIPP